MAGEDGHDTANLEQALLDRAHRYRFFQAARLLQRLNLRIEPDEVPEGGQRLRFRTPLSLSFPAAEIESMRHALDKKEGDPVTYELTVTFLGLTGPMGVLPTHYTESLIAAQTYAKREADGEGRIWRAPHDFLDLFSHRLITLFLRAWEKYHFWVRYERGEGDPLRSQLLCLLGLGSDGLQSRMLDDETGGIQDEGLAYYAGILNRRPVSAAAAQAVLGDYLQETVTIEQMVGRWLQLPADQITRLGEANATLGESATLGTRVWDRQGKFRLRIGPLDLESLKALLPGGNRHVGMRKLAGFICGIGLDFDVQLRIFRHAVPACELVLPHADAPRLGWSTWLAHTDQILDENDCTDIVLELNQKDTHDYH